MYHTQQLGFWPWMDAIWTVMDYKLLFAGFISKFNWSPMKYLSVSLSLFVGSASRRCMLDNNGVAFWGPPSFARCVSLEYRYLHLSVSFLLRNKALKLSSEKKKKYEYSSRFHHLSRVSCSNALYHKSPSSNLFVSLVNLWASEGSICF